MTAQNILDAITETSTHVSDPTLLNALRGIVARAKRYEAQEIQDGPECTCRGFYRDPACPFHRSRG